ncbi:hypothetical protein J6590_028108 [Homalodisca vitripennis]|nr:hypothetical protein J6590_028108 [Homalodisca vitripennis]
MMDSFQDLQNYCLVVSASSIRIKEMMDSFQDLQNYCLILSARFVMSLGMRIFINSSIRIKKMMDSFQDLQNYCLVVSARSCVEKNRTVGKQNHFYSYVLEQNHSYTVSRSPEDEDMPQESHAHNKRRTAEEKPPALRALTSIGQSRHEQRIAVASFCQVSRCRYFVITPQTRESPTGENNIPEYRSAGRFHYKDLRI